MHHNSDPLLTLRSAVILLLGALAALGAGILTAWGGYAPPLAVFSGACAFVPGVMFFHSTIG
ncbi:hypothetical protein ACFXAZ_37645 [Streptomyces sp. NPDC059477]|uniref:hypothetical protein n=1 Tax=Streptomyces sp. NPDC059477 TaxID=3346847 RepID=UPI00369AA1EA